MSTQDGYGSQLILPGVPCPAKKLILSVSGAKTYEQCPKKYFYNYIDKQPKKKWPHFALGTFCHAVLEHFHLEWLKDKNQQPKDLMSKVFKDIVLLDKEITREQLVDAKIMLKHYLDGVIQDGMPNVLEAEKDFQIEIDKYTLRGVVDRVDVDRDGVFHIMDYKTTKNAKYLDPFQLMIYGVYLADRFPISDFRGSYILLKHHCKKMNYDFTLYDVQLAKKKFISFAQSIESDQNWKKNPGPLCNWCDFQETCLGGWM